MMELIQNAWDEPGVTRVAITTGVLEQRNRVRFIVEDDAPDGFRDLTHAYTLFASSSKKANPEQRGRFNLGEKLVIALADTFTVQTTTGTVSIDVRKNMREVNTRKKRERGSVITADLRMSRAELQDVLAAFRTLIAPPHIETTLNGEPLDRRTPLATFTATLATEIADAEGYLRPTKRQTTVEVYHCPDTETPTLYEMGIPVVETLDTYHVNVLQKVPLNADRDNVPPAFLKDVRALVLNAMATRLTSDDAASNWVNEALEDELIEHAAVEEVLTKRYGERRVVYDPSDPEANRIAIAQGYTVIPPRAFSADAWQSIREAGAVRPAGQVTPSPKPFHEDGKPLNMIEVADYSTAQRRFARAVARLHNDLLDRGIVVGLADEPQWPFSAVYGGGRVIFNMAFGRTKPDIRNERTLGTVLHEFAHHYGDHLTHAFDDGIAILAARLIRKVSEDPQYLDHITED